MRLPFLPVVFIFLLPFSSAIADLVGPGGEHVTATKSTTMVRNVPVSGGLEEMFKSFGFDADLNCFTWVMHTSRTPYAEQVAKVEVLTQLQYFPEPCGPVDANKVPRFALELVEERFWIHLELNGVEVGGIEFDRKAKGSKGAHYEYNFRLASLCSAQYADACDIFFDAHRNISQVKLK